MVHQLPPLSMPVAKAAAYLEITRPTLESIIKAGKIRCHNLRPGGDRRISWSELVRFIEEREATGVER